MFVYNKMSTDRLSGLQKILLRNRRTNTLGQTHNLRIVSVPEYGLWSNRFTDPQ